ncbi:hypothetical protein J6590_021443 [Homalodisca vitripennis]|nr:hypothetical protein J6590_021443 [Homalodisca vitripennis]
MRFIWKPIEKVHDEHCRENRWLTTEDVKAEVFLFWLRKSVITVPAMSVAHYNLVAKDRSQRECVFGDHGKYDERLYGARTYHAWGVAYGERRDGNWVTTGGCLRESAIERRSLAPASPQHYSYHTTLPLTVYTFSLPLPLPLPLSTTMIKFRVTRHRLSRSGRGGHRGATCKLESPGRNSAALLAGSLANQRSAMLQSNIPADQPINEARQFSQDVGSPLKTQGLVLGMTTLRDFGATLDSYRDGNGYHSIQVLDETCLTLSGD